MLKYQASTPAMIYLEEHQNLPPPRCVQLGPLPGIMNNSPTLCNLVCYVVRIDSIDRFSVWYVHAMPPIEPCEFRNRTSPLPVFGFVNRVNKLASYENCRLETCRKAWSIVSNEQMTYDINED